MLLVYISVVLHGPVLKNWTRISPFGLVGCQLHILVHTEVFSLHTSCLVRLLCQTVWVWTKRAGLSSRSVT